MRKRCATVWGPMGVAFRFGQKFAGAARREQGNVSAVDHVVLI